MKKKLLLLFPGVFALAMLVPAGSLVFAVYMSVAQAQGEVLQQGLPARYIAAFDGTGIDTSALLGPHCKSAVAAGNTLTVVCEDDDDPTNRDGVTTFTPADVSTTSANLSDATATFTKSDASTFDLDLSSLQPDGDLAQAAVDARVAVGVAAWARPTNVGPIPADKLANAPDNSVASATLSEGTATFTKPDNSTFELDLSDLQNDSRFVEIAYDHAENVITLTTEGGAVIEVDLDMDYPPPPPVPTPVPSTDASLSWLTLGGTSPDEWLPHFSPSTYSYDVRVPHSTFRTFVEPHPTDGAATFTVTDNRAGDDHDATATGRLVELPAGVDTIVTVRVIAENGSHQNYVITIHRASS